MRELEIKLTGTQILGETIVNIDDKPAKFKKNGFGNLVYKYQTENDKVNIKVFRMLDVGGALWFITQLFFFIISIFGIFDIHHKERCIVIDFETEVDLKKENKLTLQVNTPQENAKAINIQTDLTSQEISNKFLLDAKAKKTLKGLKVAKILLTLVIIVTAIVMLMIKL